MPVKLTSEKALKIKNARKHLIENPKTTILNLAKIVGLMPAYQECNMEHYFIDNMIYSNPWY